MNPRHISTAADLVTSRAAIIEGFLEQAQMKTKEAVPFVARAKHFMDALAGVQSEEDLQSLLTNPETRDALISAAGLSNKASSLSDLARAKPLFCSFRQRCWLQGLFS